MGCRPPQRFASAASFGKCGVLSGALTGQKHHPAARLADEASQKIHGRCGAGGWPAPHFCFQNLYFILQNLSRRGFARILADKATNFGIAKSFGRKNEQTLSAKVAKERPQSSGGNSDRATTLVAWASFGTGFRGASTESLRAAQLLHNSFCVSLYIRLCWGSE